MPLLSCFTPFGQLEFSSGPSEAEKVYRSMLNGYRDPTSGKATIDTSYGTHKEAVIYGQAMAIGTARNFLRSVGNELRGETSYAQLEAHEARHQMSPGPNDTVVTRRLALAAKQKAARGPRFEAVWEGLGAILGTDLVAYRPITIAEAEVYPANPGAVDAPGIFRRNDAIAKSVRILDAVTRTNEPTEICDEYADTNQDLDYTYDETSISAGQSFTGNGGTVSLARFFLKKVGAPTGAAVARLYAHSGTFGTSSVPTGAALATSDPFSVSTLTGSYVLRDFTFSGANQVVLVSGTKYVIAIEYAESESGVNYIQAGFDTTAPTHAGNLSSLVAGVWSAVAGGDLCFDVLTGFSMEVAYENWNRSLVEIGLVAGDILCVDPGSWGLAERVIVTASAGSGTDRTFTATFRQPHSANVYATTGTMPLWTSSKRHVLVVVKAAAAIDPATVARIHALLKRIMRGPTTWSIVQPTTPGAGTVGPFKIGDTLGSPLGAVPIESVTL